MADRWMDERDRQMRDRDWRRSEGFGHGADSGGDVERRSWQGRDYRGVSPAMRQNEYEVDRNRPAPRTRGGPAFEDPGYGDDLRSGDYLARGDDYETGYYGRPQPAAEDGYRGEQRESFMYRAGERVASWLGLDHEGKPRTHRGRGPAGHKRSDERISDDVHDRLTEDHYLDASAITVTVSGGEVTLGGAVETREDKHRAERLAERVSGVDHVQNNLRLTPGASRGGLTSRGGVLDVQAHGDTPEAPHNERK